MKDMLRWGVALHCLLAYVAGAEELSTNAGILVDSEKRTEAWTRFAALENNSPAWNRELASTSSTPKSYFADSTDETRKSYLIPAAEIVGFDFLVNRVNEHFNGHDYEVTHDSISHNLHTSWVTDNDPFSTNQFFHPYQGSMYHGFARSAGLGYWEASAYTFMGSVLWEIAGENTPPAKNDQIASGIAGSFLGEPLFRMANLLLENGDELPKFWRELAAAVISPSTGFNRLAFGDRFDSIFPSHDPAYYSRLQIGVNTSTQNSPGVSTRYDENKIFADYSMDYGLPGKPGYHYDRPFDYFYFNLTSTSASAIENLVSRGLLYGTDYGLGDNYRGVWGIYGSYDYLSPQLFSISSTALSLGTTAQWWLSKSIALQSSVLGGAGYTAVSTLHGDNEKNYHYGVSPQAQIVLRLIFDDKVAFDVSGRDYYVNGHIENRGGHDNIARADTSLTFRIFDEHAIGIKYVWTQRDATYSDIENSTQTRGEISLFYAFIGSGEFGTVDWRK